MITAKQRELLNFIVDYQSRNNGTSPSFDEMREGLGLSSKCGIHRLITALEERGFIHRLKSRARAIEVLDDPHLPPLARFTSEQLAREAKRRGLVLGEIRKKQFRHADGQMREQREFFPVTA